jgi:hypothetical protein
MGLLCLFVMASVLGAGYVRGADESSDGKGRESTIKVTYTRYEWWLLRWSDNAIVCQVYIDHEGLPTADDILTDCGGIVYKQWLATQPCPVLGSEPPSNCLVLYLFFIGSSPAEKEIKVNLPPAQVSISLSGCDPVEPENLCPTIPKLHFVGEEPLPNEHITAIHVRMDGVETTCAGDTCDVQLHPTKLSGTLVEFWADSSFGDSSGIFTAMVRVIDSGVSASPTSGGWYIDVISDQWQGKQLATCSQVWQAFQPVGGVPDWLSTPEDPAFLASEEPYAYLAGRLIAEGVVDASSCPSGGLMSNGYADNCGLEVAMPDVIVWQNQFNEQIMNIANETSAGSWPGITPRRNANS